MQYQQAGPDLIFHDANGDASWDITNADVLATDWSSFT